MIAEGRWVFIGQWVGDAPDPTIDLSHAHHVTFPKGTDCNAEDFGLMQAAPNGARRCLGCLQAVAS